MKALGRNSWSIEVVEIADRGDTYDSKSAFEVDAEVAAPQRVDPLVSSSLVASGKEGMYQFDTSINTHTNDGLFV